MAITSQPRSLLSIAMLNSEMVARRFTLSAIRGTRSQAPPAVGARDRQEQADRSRPAPRPTVHLPIDDVAETLAAGPPARTTDHLDADRLRAGLKGRKWEIVASISIEGSSVRQVAEQFGMCEGAVAGLLTGALAATLYATHCPDDSPLFVALWYVPGMALVTLAGAAAGNGMRRW
jgi:hypothetical protein